MKLTKREVDGAAAGDRERYEWDDDLRGFGLRIGTTGAKSWVFQYRRAGRSRRMTLGATTDLTPAQARLRAEELRGLVAQKRDPLQEQQDAERKLREVGTVAALGERFLAVHAASLAPSTARHYRHAWDGYIIPALGERRLDGLRRQDLVRLHSDVKAAAPVQANRVLAAFSSAWTWGQGVGDVAEELPNPAKLPRGKRTTERRDRGTALTPEELGRLGAALATKKGPAADAMRVYLLTGCRPDEVLRAQWSDLHADGRRLKLPDSKTGPRTVYLGEVAAAIVAQQPRTGRLIFPSPHPANRGGKMLALSGLWLRRRKVEERVVLSGLKVAAGLDGSVRLYDAGRHTFTSRGYELGFAEHVVRKLTGHAEADFGAHGRYRHLGPAGLLTAADAIARSLWADLTGAAEPLPLTVGEVGGGR